MFNSLLKQEAARSELDLAASFSSIYQCPVDPLQGETVSMALTMVGSTPAANAAICT
jgi:hypothetical protein